MFIFLRKNLWIPPIVLLLLIGGGWYLWRLFFPPRPTPTVYAGNYQQVKNESIKWLGRVQLAAPTARLLSPAVIDSIKNELEPGDLMFTRRNWNVSNIGIQGYFKHGALYVGSLAELDKYFANETRTLWGESFSQHLAQINPTAFSAKKNHPVYATVEAIGEGVIMEPIDESNEADVLAVLRPRLPKEKKLEAILYALSKYGLPYDFYFDFLSDESYLCSELVYKAYAPTGDSWLKLSLVDYHGKPMFLANDFIKAFDQTYGTTNQLLDFIVYLDGNVNPNQPQRPLTELRSAWKNPDRLVNPSFFQQVSAR